MAHPPLVLRDASRCNETHGSGWALLSLRSREVASGSDGNHSNCNHVKSTWAEHSAQHSSALQAQVGEQASSASS